MVRVPQVSGKSLPLPGSNGRNTRVAGPHNSAILVGHYAKPGISASLALLPNLSQHTFPTRATTAGNTARAERR